MRKPKNLEFMLGEISEPTKLIPQIISKLDGVKEDTDTNSEAIKGVKWVIGVMAVIFTSISAWAIKMLIMR